MNKPFLLFLFGAVCASPASDVNPNPPVPRAEGPARIEREKLPVGSNRTDPVLRNARIDVRTAQLKWKKAISAHLQQAREAAQGNFTLADEQDAESAFISENFEEFVALRRLQLEHIHQIRQWHQHRTAVTPGIPELFKEVLPVQYRSNSETERLDLEAYLSAGTTLLVLEARVETARAEAALAENNEE